ncbi:Lysyl oxidase 3 [Cichlidogyrus casuarinus]|uniref:Lysyl oxidase 3 n=1 Tax=Cichlidogyrus casuarinus TaxID=1844966 RepID=A0ABD2PXB5_9PLAT
MKVFAVYNLIDSEKRVLASGHKASFCLEDSSCETGVSKKFQCSNVVNNYGTQGISPGCKDTYYHDYDCQWIDITDIREGTYELQVAYNPEFLVPEQDFFNNGLRCSVMITDVSAHIRNCVPMHPLDMTYS